MIRKILSNILLTFVTVFLFGGVMCLCCLLIYAIERLMGSTVLAYFTHGVIWIVIIGTITGIIEWKKESAKND